MLRVQPVVASRQSALFGAQRICAPSNSTINKLSAKTQTYNCEVVVGDNEPEDAALKRFRRAVTSARVLPEVQRRRFHETKQDTLKRKQRERGLRKKMPPPRSWDEQVTSIQPAPFAEMFGESEDIFADGSSLFGLGSPSQ